MGLALDTPSELVQGALLRLVAWQKPRCGDPGIPRHGEAHPLFVPRSAISSRSGRDGTADTAVASRLVLVESCLFGMHVRLARELRSDLSAV